MTARRVGRWSGWMLGALLLGGGGASGGTVIDANPSNYRALLPTLQPGDTLNLAAGNYTQNLPVSGLNGNAGAWITIQGPASGSPALFPATAAANTVDITNSSYLAIRNLTLDGQGLDGPDGIKAGGGVTNLVHHILIEGCTIRNYNGSQQSVGISTKAPTWNWTVRRNRIISAGTGLYLGNSDGSCPFVAGTIESNLVQNPLGYCMEIKYQAARPAIAGMPTGQSRTVVRNNVFIKNDAASPSGDRPNLLVGGFPDSGAGSTDLYEIYANFFHHNPRESLLQASGRVSIHDNIFTDVAGTAVRLQDHDLPLKLAHVYNNTVYSAGTGISVAQLPDQEHEVFGNLIFATTAISGAASNVHDNLADTAANAGLYVKSPSTALGAMDFYPLAGKCQGTALDLSGVSGETDYNYDFNGVSKGTFKYRGAYAGEGTNPGWTLQADIKVGGPSWAVNIPPVAAADVLGGVYTVPPGTPVTLSGSGSYDPDNYPSGGALTYLWSKTAGPAVTLNDATLEFPTFTPTATGTYTFKLVVNDGAANSADLTSPDNAVTVYVSTATTPVIELSTAALAPRCKPGTDAAGQSFTVRNSGGGTLDFAVSADAAWLSCSPGSGTSTGEAKTVAVTYATSGLPAGTYGATITVSGTGATSKTIAVTLKVTSSSGGGGGGGGGCSLAAAPAGAGGAAGWALPYLALALLRLTARRRRSARGR